MLSRFAKQSFYNICGPFMALNGTFHRYARNAGKRDLKVHLGPGINKYVNGWVNVDANMFTGKCDIWADLRNPLPFGNDSVSLMYSHHVVEHLPDLEKHFRDAFRCLEPGGWYRVGGPNGDCAIKMFLEGRSDWFPDFPDKRVSMGGRLENFIFCRREHLTILTYSFLEELLTEAGFVNLKQCKPISDTGVGTAFKDCMAFEHERDMDNPRTLLIEAQKPAA